ncbi:hypothetical protein LCGC14_0413890 [marine sediment metagenome]|uniref:Uncharacterized protein n=1 Tax=marine sediment metagenome TaxID=412755 RepID=A0A0F9W205_9ZZZZ
MDAQRQLEMLHTIASTIHILWRTHTANFEQANMGLIGQEKRRSLMTAFDVELHNIRAELEKEINDGLESQKSIKDVGGEEGEDNKNSGAGGC